MSHHTTIQTTERDERLALVDASDPVIGGSPRMAGALVLGLFGGLRIACAGRDLSEGLPGRQGRALTAYLVLNRDRSVSRDELLNVLWPSRPPSAPEAALSSVLAKVRRAIEPAIICGRQALTLQLPAGSQIDAAALDAQMQRADRAVAERDPETALGCAQAALELLAQPLLPDLDGEWLEPWRRRFDDLVPRALEISACAGLELGDGQSSSLRSSQVS